MDLSEIIVPEGAVGKPIVTCVIEGHLEEEDLRELTLSVPTEPVEGDDPSDLKKIKEKHHSVARMVASGLTQRMVAQLCGYTESYLSVLLNNPAMQELVELYRIQQGAATQVITEKLKTVGLKAIEKLEAQIEADALSNQELLSAAKLGLDRAGHGPSSSHHVIEEQHQFDHAELTRLNLEARSRNATRIVPASEVRAALPAPVEQKDETDRTVGSETSEHAQDRGESQPQE